MGLKILLLLEFTHSTETLFLTIFFCYVEWRPNTCKPFGNYSTKTNFGNITRQITKSISPQLKRLKTAIQRSRGGAEMLSSKENQQKFKEKVAKKKKRGKTADEKTCQGVQRLVFIFLLIFIFHFNLYFCILFKPL